MARPFPSMPRSAPAPASIDIVARASACRVVLLEKLGARDLLLRYFCEFQDEVDDLLLEDRRPQGRDRIRILPIVVPDFLLATGILARLLDDRPRHLLVGYLDIVPLAD